MSGKKLMIAAAGTGGHVMPGLAVAREMRRRGWEVHWIGTQHGMEGKLIARDGIEFTGLNFRGMRGHGLMGLITGAVKLVKSTFAAKKTFAQVRPDVLFTTGGYIAVPVCKGAESTKTPIVLMNCDSDILMSSKIVLDKAKLVACGFAGSARSCAREKGRITGNHGQPRARRNRGVASARRAPRGPRRSLEALGVRGKPGRQGLKRNGSRSVGDV